jgi:hypothetical protein
METVARGTKILRRGTQIKAASRGLDYRYPSKVAMVRSSRGARIIQAIPEWLGAFPQIPEESKMTDESIRERAVFLIFINLRPSHWDSPSSFHKNCTKHHKYGNIDYT